MKYSPQYFRPLGTGDVGYTCYRQNDLVLGIHWWRDEDAVRHYGVFCGFANPKSEDVRAVRQARKSIDVLATRKGGIHNLLWVKQQMYAVINHLIVHDCEAWRFSVQGADLQRHKVYGRLLKDPCWKLIDDIYYYVADR